MKTCPNCKAELHDSARTCLCGYFYPLETDSRQIIGGLMIAAGAITVLLFATVYETTIRVSSEAGIPGMFDRVQNMGLNFNRLIGVLVGLTTFLGGIILIAAPKSPGAPKK